MSVIGDAFAHVAVDIALFLVVMLVLFLAFAILFFVNFRLVLVRSRGDGRDMVLE